MPRGHKKAQKINTEASEVRSRVSAATNYTRLYIVVVTLAVTAILGSFLWGANRAYVALAHHAGQKFYAPVVVPFMLGGFIGFCVAFFSCEQVHRRLLGPPPKQISFEYSMATEPTPSLLRRLYILATIVFCLFAAMNVRKYAVFTDSAIIDQRAMALTPVEYRYSDIRQITMSRYFIPPSKSQPGHISTSRAMYVWFRAGNPWSLKDSELSAGVMSEERVAEQLAKRCHLTVDYPDSIVGLPDPEGIRKRGRQMVFGVSAIVILALIVWGLRLHFRLWDDF